MKNKIVKQEKDIQLHPQQLVVEVLEIMLYHEQYTLPMYHGERCVRVDLKDLIAFLVEKRHGHSMLFHKFNFTLESVVAAAFLPL